MTGSVVSKSRLMWVLLAALAVSPVWTGQTVSAEDDSESPAGDSRAADFRGAARLVDVSVTLYRSSLTGGDQAIYDEIFSHFADAIFEATEGQHIIDDINVFLDGQPGFDSIPVITVLGANPSFVEAGSAYIDAGATAFDFPDGNVTVTTTGTVNTAVAGRYTITYRATDSRGQMAVDTRVVNVRGRDPVITVSGINPITVFQDSLYIDAGATATDVTDGNLTGDIFSLSDVDTSAAGVYEVLYFVLDSEGNFTIATRVVNVVTMNSDIPVIILQGANPMTIDANATYIEPGAVAFDLTDGLLNPNQITITGFVATSVAGSYQLLYTATDSDGDMGVATRVVNVIGRDPVITVLGANPVTIEAGNVYVDAGAVATDVTDGNITVLMATEIDVDTSRAGTGTVTYFVSDLQDKFSFATRTVHVVENVNRGHESDIYWMQSGVPGFRTSGGIRTPGGQILMSDVFPGAEAGADIDFLSTSEDRRRAGYILASLWMQYALGLGSEFAARGGDIPVLNSLLADPYAPAFAANGLGLNVSATRDGVATGGVFQSLESTGRTEQFRLNGASAWATMARTYGEDAKPARLIAKRPRTAYPELRNNAPIGDAAPATNLAGIPTGSFGGARYLDEQRSYFRIGTENSLPIVSGERIRTQMTCVPGRLIDVRTPNPVVFEFPSDTDVNDLIVGVSVPCTDDISNLDAELIDPLGRVVPPVFYPASGVLEFRKTPSVPGTWRLTISPRNVSTLGVQVDVLARSFNETHRISSELVNAPSDLASHLVTYPNPFVVQVSDTKGRALRGVTAYANVTSPTGAERIIDLVDDGRSPDLFANDGIYAGFIPYFQNGTYLAEFVMADLQRRASFTSSGMSNAPTQGFVSVENTARPADGLLGEAFMRDQIVTFSVAGLAADDHGDTYLEATPVPLTNADIPARFDRAGDVDYYSIDVSARGSTADVAVRATNWSGPGQIQLTLFDATGITQVARGSNSPSGYPMIRANLVSGRYYLAAAAPNARRGDTYSVSAGAPVPSDLAAIGIALNVGAGGGGGGGGGGGCFIATAAYGTPLETEIDSLRAMRDAHLLTNPIGATFSDAYYRLSPPVADLVAKHALLRGAVRGGIRLALHPAWIAALLMGLMSMAAVVSVTRRRRHADRVR